MVIIFIALSLVTVSAQLMRGWFMPRDVNKWEWKNRFSLINDAQKNILNK